MRGRSAASPKPQPRLVCAPSAGGSATAEHGAVAQLPRQAVRHPAGDADLPSTQASEMRLADPDGAPVRAVAGMVALASKMGWNELSGLKRTGSTGDPKWFKSQLAPGRAQLFVIQLVPGRAAVRHRATRARPESDPGSSFCWAFNSPRDGPQCVMPSRVPLRVGFGSVRPIEQHGRHPQGSGARGNVASGFRLANHQHRLRADLHQAVRDAAQESAGHRAAAAVTDHHQVARWAPLPARPGLPRDGRTRRACCARRCRRDPRGRGLP